MCGLEKILKNLLRAPFNSVFCNEIIRYCVSKIVLNFFLSNLFTKIDCEYHLLILPKTVNTPSWSSLWLNTASEYLKNRAWSAEANFSVVSDFLLKPSEYCSLKWPYSKHLYSLPVFRIRVLWSGSGSRLGLFPESVTDRDKIRIWIGKIRIRIHEKTP